MTINIDNVSIKYGKVLAVSEVSLLVPAGAITGLLGKNGSGKTSLLWAAVNLQKN
jgi:ABC-type multidrug transport system ATPase subunit